MRRFALRPRRLALWALGSPLLLLGCLALADLLWPLSPVRFDRVAVSPELYDRDGELFHERVGPDEQWRRPRPLEEMVPWLSLATIAVEDERFRLHPGVDPLAVGRAVLSNLAAGRVVSGASTLTMQLARMSHPRPRTLRSKLIEAFRAWQLERRYDKDELLERYLNRAPYGSNLRGVEMAARRWFGRGADELALHEAALIAGLPQSPERLRPDRHPERARVRRDHVLDRMWVSGVIDRRSWRAARAEPVRLARRSRASSAPHFATLALARRPGGGTTTLDLDLQREVELLAAEHAATLPAGSDVALVIVDVAESGVLALVGSLDPEGAIDGQVNGATARRSPGSTLKPFIYAAAFESGRLEPESVVQDAPLDLAGWRPANFDRGHSGSVTAAEALRRSLNLPALAVARRAGLSRCLGVIEASGLRLGPGAARRSGLSLVTGGSEARLIDVVNGYATLARGGVHRPLRFFADEVAPATRALSTRTSKALERILSSAVAPPLGWDRGRGSRDFMWKTGTSAGHRDAWAVGHDGRYAVGVWVGRFGGSPHAAYVGRTAAEPLLARVFATLCSR